MIIKADRVRRVLEIVEPSDFKSFAVRMVGEDRDNDELLERNALRCGGGPCSVIIFGQSAGATHVTTALFDPQFGTPSNGIQGVVLAGGFYRMTEAHRAPNLASAGDIYNRAGRVGCSGGIER